MRKLILVLLIGFFIGPLQAEAKGRKYNIFVAPGQNFSSPVAVIRVGANNWEFGSLVQGTLGFAKMFWVDDVYYTGFGPVLAAGSAGFYMGAGFDKVFWGGLGVRGEFQSFMAGNGGSQGLGILGLSYSF